MQRVDYVSTLLAVSIASCDPFMIPGTSEERTSDCLSGTQKEPRRNWFQHFLPRSSSNAVFIFTMTCYTFTLEYLGRRSIRLFGFWSTSRIDHLTSTPLVPLLISPVVDSFVVIGLIEAVRRLRFNVAVQIAVAVSISCFLESPRQPFSGLLVAPVFLIGAGAYIYWRPVAFWIAARTIILLHFFYNALVFIGVTAERMHR
jgi:hypothetical protein